MRIAFIGDLQYWKADIENLEYKMKQIAGHNPDLAIVMGDFGGSKMRSVEGLLETKHHVDLIGCPWQGIMGNHDVEYNSEYMYDYDPVGTFKKVFEKEPFSATVIDGVLVLCITIERQPLDTLRTIHAVYVSDEQYEWAREQLKKHEGMPTILVTHAHMAGAGIRCDRPLHTSATDTYLEQTFKPERWQALIKEFPQIKAWCSAHLHMGHDYDTAITYRDSVMHISCGVMTCCTRDESCNTRIIDVKNGRLTVYTLDHNNDKELSEDAVLDLTGAEAPKGRYYIPQKGEILVGEDDSPTAVYKHPYLDRYYVATAKAFLWEYDGELWDFTGTLAYERKVKSLSADSDRLYIEFADGEIRSVDPHSRKRWQYTDHINQEYIPESELKGDILKTVPFSTFSKKEGIYVKFI
ncbi:MAG: metallophosphoesterase [Clostridia bacterium]|nr:metallophosphoesterase [Clostridia bacterium]